VGRFGGGVSGGDAGAGDAGVEGGPVGSIGGGLDRVGSALNGVPGDIDRVAVRGGGDEEFGGGRAASVFCHGFADTVDGCPVRRAVEPATDDVGKPGRAVGFDGKEVGVGALGEFGGDAGASVVKIEVEVGALGLTEVAEVGVVLEVVTQDVSRAYGGTLGIGRDGRAAVLGDGGPGGKGGAAGGVEIGGAVGAVAFDVTGDHAANAAGRVVGVAVAVRAVDGVAIA